MSTPSCPFFAIFTNGNNFRDFLFAAREKEALQKGNLLLEKMVTTTGKEGLRVGEEGANMKMA